MITYCRPNVKREYDNGGPSLSRSLKGYSNSSTSLQVGMDALAPLLLTARAAAMEAILKASSTQSPLRILPMKNPVKVSPAAVVSTVFTG